MLVDDQRLTFIEGSVRRSVGAATLEVSAARESNGGTAARAQLLGKLGAVYVNAEALIANDFHLRGGPAQSLRDGRIALDAPVKLGKTVFPVPGSAVQIENGQNASGCRPTESGGRPLRRG